MPLLQSLGLSLGVPGQRRPSTLYPWHRAPAPGRVRRAWVIPPISVSENHKRLPYPLVQVRGAQTGEGGESWGQSRGWAVPGGSPRAAHLWGHRPSYWGRSQGQEEGGTLPFGAPAPAGLLSWQIKSDKQPLGSVIYSIQGPGVDEEPQGVFSIDKFTGKVFLNAMLDREKTDRFRVGPAVGSAGRKGGGGLLPPPGSWSQGWDLRAHVLNW